MAFGVVVTGKMPYGRVERIGGSCVQTTFSHFWFLPIVPHGSYVHSESGSEVKEVGIGWHLTSILACYARVWGVIWWIVCAIYLFRSEPEFVLGTPVWVDFVLLSGIVVWGWLVAGRVSRRTAAQRRVYAKFAGVPVDVTRYSRAQAQDLREELERVLVEEGRGQRFAYRDGQEPRVAWRQIALHDDVFDPKYLEAALTRARLESRWAPSRDERRAHARAHDRIWHKLANLPRPG